MRHRNVCVFAILFLLILVQPCLECVCANNVGEEDATLVSVNSASNISSMGANRYLVLQNDGGFITSTSSYSLTKTMYQNSSTYQQWVFEEVTSGIYIIRMKNNTNKCLTAVPGACTVTLSNYSAGNKNQQWTLFSGSGGNYLQSESTDGSINHKRLTCDGNNYALGQTGSPVVMIDIATFVPCTAISISDINIEPDFNYFLHPKVFPSNATQFSDWVYQYTFGPNNCCTMLNNWTIRGAKVGHTTVTIKHKITGVTCTAQVNVHYWLPRKTGQNKNNWCWVASSKAVGEHNGGSGALVSGVSNLASYDNLHTYNAKPFYGKTYSGCYAVDSGQRQIVMSIYGNDKDQTGSYADIQQALQMSSNSNMSIGYLISGSLSASLNQINNELSQGRWVVLAVFPTTSGVGHAIVLRDYNSTYSRYSYYDPWSDACASFSLSELLNGTIQFPYNSSNYYGAQAIYCR